MTLNVNSIRMVSPKLLQLNSDRNNTQTTKLQTTQSSTKQTVNLNEMASSIKSVATNHDTKTADLTDIKEDAGALAGGLVMDATTQGVLGTILKRTVGVPGIADADKIIAETLKNVKDPSIVKNVENAWDDWKKNYYKNGNISFGGAVKAGINLIPTMGRGICNSALETGTKVVQTVLGDDGAKAVSDGVHALADGIKTIGDTVVAPFSGMINLIKGDKQAANDAFNTVWTDVKNTGKALKDTAESVVKYVGNSIEKFAKDPIGTTVNVVKDTVQGIKTTVNTVVDTVKTVGKKIGGFFKSIFS